MVFVEFSAFYKRRQEYLDDEAFREMQNAILQNPELGQSIPGTGGLRKLRWAAQGKGKRGGIRVIYYYFAAKRMVLLLLVYSKNVQDDLSPEQKKMLRELVARELGGKHG
jgi:mRNA-degrading endonuclease RelE of RelBE toxin-antitoxin system